MLVLLVRESESKKHVAYVTVPYYYFTVVRASNTTNSLERVPTTTTMTMYDFWFPTDLIVFFINLDWRERFDGGEFVS